MSLPTYCLTSLESYMLEQPRTCTFVKLLQLDTGKECVLATVDPAIRALTIGTEDAAKTVYIAYHASATMPGYVNAFWVIRTIRASAHRRWR